MNKKTVENILKEDRASEFFRLLYRNDFLRECILEIIDNKLSSLSRTSPVSELTDSSWPLKRAYQDGGKYNLESLRKVFEEQSK